MSLRRLALIVCGALAATSFACGGGDAENKPAAAEAPAKKSKKAEKKEAAETEEQRPPPVGPPIDFNDSAAMRDPFLSYAREFAEEAKKRVRSQRDVVLDQYGL